MNKKLPSYLLEKFQLIGTLTFSVLFAVVFLNIYIPFSDTAWFRLGNSVFFLFTAGFAAVSILFLIFSRVLMYHLKKYVVFTYLGYVLWCIAEVVIICLLYTGVTVEITDRPRLPALQIFAKALLYGSISLIIPYIISGMFFTIVEKNRTIRLMRCNNVISDEERMRDSKITLFDNSGALKLSVSTSNLYYIESDDNYIKVWYSDNRGELKTYMLRCRLKTVEETFRNGPLVRCHRKYIVNLEKVKVLRKEADGYYLDIDNEKIPSISVTKTYIGNVLEKFTPEETSGPAV